MQNKNKLRNVRNEAYYINHDLTRRERAIWKQIRERTQTEKHMGKQVKIEVRKLVINGEEWKCNKEKEKLEARVTKRANRHGREEQYKRKVDRSEKNDRENGSTVREENETAKKTMV